jgi:hypothetical protein
MENLVLTFFLVVWDNVKEQKRIPVIVNKICLEGVCNKVVTNKYSCKQMWSRMYVPNEDKNTLTKGEFHGKLN